jgi:hypothetical protein
VFNPLKVIGALSYRPGAACSAPSPQHTTPPHARL